MKYSSDHPGSIENLFNVEGDAITRSLGIVTPRCDELQLAPEGYDRDLTMTDPATNTLGYTRLVGGQIEYVEER